MSLLVSELNLPIVDTENKNDRINHLLHYFSDSKNNNEWYALRFFLCETLNFINVIGQIFFVDFFLGGEFSTYGSDVISISEMPNSERFDPMAHVFPKVFIIDDIISLGFDANFSGDQMHIPQVWSLWYHSDN